MFAKTWFNRFSNKNSIEAQEQVSRASSAQQIFKYWSEQRVDDLLQDIAMTVSNQAPTLAQATVTETGMGVVAHKITKIRFASLDVYQSLAGCPASGRLQSNSDNRIMEIASPMGLIRVNSNRIRGRPPNACVTDPERGL